MDSSNKRSRSHQENITMASANKKSRSHQENTTLASSSSSPSLNGNHHVFTSFHGPDVRVGPVSHIHKKFISKGISTFVDNNIERGMSIGPVLTGAIRGSRIALVLLSERYASSTWCLNELVEIIKCKKELGQTVMALFYKVDPTHVKKQTGAFGKVFRETCKGKTKEDIGRWEHALKEVAQIAGYHSGNWNNESEMFSKIATDVSNKLNISSPSSDFDDLVGMESHMTKMGPLLWLDSEEVRMIGIWGPPGIGKTTIARFIFKRLYGDFQLSLFMDNIKRKYPKPACSDDYSVKLSLQEQFMSQLIKEEGLEISHLGIVQDRLKDKKVLVVLDDVDQLVQLEAMAKKTTWFGDGSRIIITTQDQKLLKASGVNHIYKVDLPSRNEALQMFCMYAFGQKEPEAGFTELAREVTQLIGELPLGLKIMGSHFRVLPRSKQEWRKAIQRLMIRLDGDIKKILKFSYDALDDEEKILFLHIACIFEDESVDIMEGCLANSSVGLGFLAEKSLISLDWGEMEMHKLLVQLGREIVVKQSYSEPGKRQFLDDAEDIEEVLCDDKADTSSVIGINIWFRRGSEEDIICTSERAFERFSNLRFLKIDGELFHYGDGPNPRSLSSISRKLRFLSWKSFGMPCLPCSFYPRFLVKLDMPYSKLEKLWEGIQPLRNLKEMDLSHSESLKELSDLSTATNLCKLDLSYCTSLVELPSSLGNAVNLTTLDLTRCSSLVKLPFLIGNAVNLTTLNLTRCSNLVELPYSIGNAKKLQILNLSHCLNLVKLPSSIGNAIDLQQLDLSFCSSLDELPSSMRNLCKLSKLELVKCSKLEVNLATINLESLKELDFSYCALLKSYPESSTSIQDLHKLSGAATKGATSSMRIQELGPWIGRVSRLRRLVLSGMQKLVSLPQLPYSVVELDADNCESLERLDCSFRNPYICLSFAKCFKLNQEARDLIIQTPTNEYAVVPGKEVPVCFPYRSYGSSVTVKLNQMPLGRSTKFKACIILVGEHEWKYEFISFTIKNALGRFSGRGKDFPAEEWVGYGCEPNICLLGRESSPVCPEHLYTFEVEAGEVTSTELVFEFQMLTSSSEMKECGVLQL